MSRRLRLPLLLALTFCLGVLLGHTLTRRDPPAADPAARLRERAPDLHVAPAGSGAFFVTDRPRDRAELEALVMNPSRLESWKGVVRSWPVAPDDRVDDSGWGRAGFRQGGHAYFGDPQLVRRIKAALR